MSTTFVLIVEVIKHSSQIKYKDLPLCDLIISLSKTPDQGQSPICAAIKKVLSKSEIAGLLLRMPRSRLGHMQYWLASLMLWHIDSETYDLQKWVRLPHCGQQPLVTKLVFWCLPLHIKNCSRNVIKYKIKMIDVSDKVWMWIHQIYGMSLIVQNCIHSKQTTALTSLFPEMVNWIDKIMKLMTCNAQTVK